MIWLLYNDKKYIFYYGQSIRSKTYLYLHIIVYFINFRFLS